MKVCFETMKEDDVRHLETAEVAAVPRVGEHVLMRGEKYGGRRRYGDDSTLFEVVDVRHEVEGGEVEVTVFLRLDEQDEQVAVFRPRCGCKEENRLIDDDDPQRCDNCGELAWWRK